MDKCTTHAGLASAGYPVRVFDGAARALASVAVLDSTLDGYVTFATEKAKGLLKKYFPESTRLPNTLVHCLRKCAPRESMFLLPWVADGGDEQLAVRLTGRLGGHFQLLLDERPHAITVDRLKGSFGVTCREAEVLLWIIRGKTSPEIAAILGCKAATVNKHTERILAKLGVETRTAAAAIAREIIL